jgi:uncharacterized membrane protein YccF (DUF307 family)
MIAIMEKEIISIPFGVASIKIINIAFRSHRYRGRLMLKRWF